MKDRTANIVRDIERSTKTLLWWSENSEHYEDLIKKLEAIGYEASLSTTGLDISGSGDKQMLINAFRILRAAGFNCSRRPEAKDTYFSTFFEHDELKHIWFSFSSTVCQRVKVGTELREVDVYETQCSDSMAVSDEEINNG